MAENIFSLGQLEDRLVEKGLGEMLSGEYLEKNVSKQFAAEDKRTLNAAVEMAKRGVKHSLSLGLARVEKAAKDKGFSVGFSFNEKTNEVDVILYEGKTQQEINAQSKKEFLDFKAEMPHFRLAIGTPTRGTKYRMPSTKALAAHIDNEGAYFTTEIEDTLEGVADKLSSLKRYKGQSGEDFKRRTRSAVKRGKESAIKSIISTEAYSIVDDEKYYEELRHQQSATRDTFLQTDVKTAGILGEVAKKLDLTRTIKKARNLTNKQVESYNRRIDNLLTKYQITYQTLGKQAAENLMKNADIWSELMIEEKQVDKILSDTEKYFGSFLQMRGQIGLSSDEAMQRKTMSFAGQRDVALRGKVETNRHPSQARNYLRRKDQTVRRRTEMVIPAAMKDEMDYFSGSDKQLYKKALVTSEADIYDAYIGAIDDAIKEELKKLRGQKANKGVSEEKLQKMAEERVRKNLPVIAPSVLDDMGIISASAAKSLDSVRTVAKNITKDEYNKLNAEATKKWQKLIDSGKTPKMPQDEYISNYIAKKATGRSKLSDISINIGENGGVDISALEDVKFGGQAKTLDYNENLRETKQVLPDNIVKFMAQRLGISGAIDMIGRAKSVKASEIPQYVQMILTTWAIENGLDANGINQLAINVLGRSVVQGVTEDGKLIIDNARDLWDNYDWDSALSRMAEMGMIHKTASGYSLGKAGDKAFSLYDVVNVADVWNSTKDVKTSYKESSGVFRDIQSMSTRAQSEGEKKAFNELNKEVKAMYDPMAGAGADEAKKAKEDIDKILNEKTGSIVRTYESKKDEDREKSVRKLKKEHYDLNKKFKKKKTYLVTIGPGTDYTIDTNTLMQDVDYSKGDGMLTEEEYQKTALGRIEQITNDIKSKAGADANIEYVIDPGTDFGFSMSFGEDGKEEGATGRFVVLPNIQTNYRVNEQGEKLYSLPEYAKDISSLVGAINLPGSNLAGEKAQELTKSIFTTANYGKSSLRQAAETKRIGGSKSVHPIGISNEQIERLLLGSEEDKKRATELISSIYVSRELAKEMLSDKTRFIDKNKKYDSSVHENAINEALKYAGVDLSTLSDSTIDQKIDVLLDSITEGDGRAVKGISSIINRYPSISKHSAAFASVKIDPSMTGLQMKVGPGLMKFMNGDYDGDTVNLILGLWGSGYSIEAAAEMVERQRRINERVYKKMSAAEKAKSGDDFTMISGSDVGKSADFLNLSALATKFNKPYTGLFSNISTKIREGLNASGYDYDILTNESSNTDYVKVIQGELVSVVGQILEQDSISAKKVEKRIQKTRDKLGRELTQEEKNLEQQNVLTEFENLDKMLRDPQFSFSEIIDKMKEMELFSDDVSQISSVITSIIQDLTRNLGDGRRENIYQRLGLNEADLEKGVLNADAIKKAGSSIEYATGMKIFGGEYGKGFATSREFTPHMKNDEYQLLKFVKSVDEANNVLKTMGELIDENGNRFSQYGEKIKGAMGALKLEAGQEVAKTIIAGKENKAISALAVSYGGLSGQLADAKDAYDKFGTGKSYGATAHDVASLLNPSNYTVVEGKTISKDALAEQIVSATSAKSDPELYKIKKELGESNYIQALKETTEALDKGADEKLAAQSGLTGADLLKERNRLVREAKQNAEARLGFKGTIKEFRDKRESFIHTQEGTYIHALAQQIDTAGRDDVINAEVEKQRALLGAQMRSLGFAESEITKRVEKASKSAKALYDKTKSFGSVDFTEQKLTSTESGSQGFVHGAADAIAIDENGNITIIDWKTGQKSITDENKAQVAVYQSILEEYRGKLKDIYEKNFDGKFALRNQSGDNSYVEDIINQFYKENIVNEGLKARFGEEGAKDLLRKILLAGGGREDAEGNRIFDQAIRGAIVLSNSQGISSWSGAGGIPPVLAEKLLYSPESLTRDEKAIIYAGGTYIPGGSSTGKKGKSSGGGSSAGGSSEKENSLKSEYIKLLKEQYDLMIKIDALEHKRDEMLGRGEDVTAVEKDIDVLKSALEQQKELLSDKRFKKTTKDKSVTDFISTQEHRVSYQKSLLGIGDAEDTLKAFERYATKRMKLESEIEQAQLKASTTVGNEKKAWENVVTLKQQSLKASEDTYEILKKQAIGVDKDRAQEIIDAVDQQKAILSAQKLAGNRGNRTIFDVIKSDIQRATMRITDFGLAAKVLNTARKEIQQVYQNILKLDEAMTNLRIVTGSNTEQAKNMMNTYNDLAMQLGTTTQAVAQSAAEWLRQGYSVSEANELIKSSTYLSRLGFMDMNQSVTALTSVMKGFRIEATDSMDIVDKLTQLDAKYATTAGDIATALSRTSAVAREAGLNLDQTAAALTTMIDVSQQDASSVGNAFRTILARYGNVKATAFTSLVGDSDDIDDTNGSINDTEKVLGAIGIKIRSSSSDMRDFDDVMDELADKWVTLTDVEKNAVSTALAGVRQRNIFGIYMENYDTYKQAISEAEKAEGTAARKMQAYNESVAYSINQLSAAWEGFAQKLEANGAIKLFFNGLRDLVENLGTRLAQIVSTIVSMRSFKLTTDLKHLADFFGFEGTGMGRVKTGVKNIWSTLTGKNEVNKAAREAEKYAQQKAGTYEEQSRNKIVNSNNRVVNALNRNADALNRNSDAQNAKQAKQPMAPESATNTPPINNVANTNDTTVRLMSVKRAQIEYDEAKKEAEMFKDGMVPDDVAARLSEAEANLNNASASRDAVLQRMKASRAKRLAAIRKQVAVRSVSSGLTAGIISGVSAEGDTSDKIRAGLASGVSTGLLSAIPGVGALVGPILGPILGGVLDKYILKPLLKADEIARKDRVQQAKDNLKAIRGISTSVTGLIDLRKKGDTSLWDSDDWKQAGEYVESITSARDANEDFKDAMDKAVDGVEGFSWTIEGMTKNQETLAKIEAARIKYEAEQTYAAGEQDRYDLLKKIEEAQKTLSKSTDEEEKKKAEASITANKAAIREYADELNKAYMKSAFYSSGISNMSQAQKNTASLDRLVLEWAIAAQEAAKDTTGEKWLDDQGRVKDESRSTIIQQIREAGGYEAVLTGSEKSVRDYKNANLIAANYVKELNKREGFAGLTVDKLKELANTADGIEKLKSALGKEEATRVIDAINDVDETKIATIAHSLNMTVEEFERANKNGDFDFFTTGMALENLDAFIERIDKLGDSFAELAVKGKLSGDALNNVIKNYAFLLEGKGSFSTENIVDNLVDLYVGGNDSTIAQAIAGKFQREASTREDWWDAWKNSSVAAGFKETTGKEWKSTTFKTFKEAVNEMSEEEQKSYSEFVASMFNADMLDAINDKIIEYKTNAYDQEIANLQSIKDAIGDVNKQREKELELIKAKEALENASKEKVRVYREGMGFVYTTNQEAVKSAQEKVDELEKQQTQDDLQYQIDILNQQKSILQNIEKNEELKNLTDVVEKIQHALGDKSIFSQIVNGKEEQDSLAGTIADGILLSTQKVKEEENKDAAKAAAKELKNAKTTYDAFVRENESILGDPNNPAYKSTYEKYQKQWENLQDARAKFKDAASQVKGGFNEKIDEDGNKSWTSNIEGANGDLLKAYGYKEKTAESVSSEYKIFGEEAKGVTLDSSITPEAIQSDIEKHMIGGNRSENDKYIIYRYDPSRKEWRRYKTSDDFDSLKEKLQPFDVVRNDWWADFGWSDRAIYVDENGKIRWVNNDTGNLFWGTVGVKEYDELPDLPSGKTTGSTAYVPRTPPSPSAKVTQSMAYASGTLSSTGGPSLINENGLESIITPQGTITSLPAKSGIIPADLTRNLWALGEVAPNLIARLGGSNLQTNNNVATNDNSINVDTLNATFNTTKDFDTQKFWMAVKNETILTKNNH